MHTLKRVSSPAENETYADKFAFRFGASAVKQSSGGRCVCVTDGRAPAFFAREYGWYRGIFIRPFSGRIFYLRHILHI